MHQLARDMIMAALNNSGASNAS